MCLFLFLVKRSVFFSFYWPSTLCYGCQTQIPASWYWKAYHRDRDRRVLGLPSWSVLGYQVSLVCLMLSSSAFPPQVSLLLCGPRPWSINPDTCGPSSRLSRVSEASSAVRLCYILMENLLSVSFHHSYLGGYEIVYHCGLICISLVTEEVEHFMFLAMRICSGDKNPLKLFAHFQS